MKKCEFSKCDVKYLGYIVGSRKLQEDWEKVQAVKDWPAPTRNCNNSWTLPTIAMSLLDPCLYIPAYFQDVAATTAMDLGTEK